MPSRARGLWLRNTLFALPSVQSLMIRSTHALATDAELPRYAYGS